MDWVTGCTLFGVAVVGSYAIGCWWWPFAKCLRCHGAGKFARADGKVWRDCRRCKGSGRRLRVGRKVWNYYHRNRSRANR